MKTGLLVVALCLFSTAGIAADANEASNEVQACQTGEVFMGPTERNPDQNASSVADAIYWDFITCTYSVAECRWEADYHGYYHYKAVHDHFHCGGHTHYACYGGHH